MYVSVLVFGVFLYWLYYLRLAGWLAKLVVGKVLASISGECWKPWGSQNPATERAAGRDAGVTRRFRNNERARAQCGGSQNREGAQLLKQKPH